MKKKTAILTLCAVGAITATAAWAGAKGGPYVNIDLANRRASGSLGGARNSIDAVQFLGCVTTGNTNGAQTATCWAQNAAGTYISCLTTSPVLIDMARSLNGDSVLQFHWDATGQCTYLYIENDSYYAPKSH